MKRFFLSNDAHRDLDSIIAYLRSLPNQAALRLGSSLQQALYQIADSPDWVTHKKSFQRWLTLRSGALFLAII